jgi:acetyl esterase/lipase
MNWRDRLCLFGLTRAIRFNQPLDKLRSQMVLADYLAIKPFGVKVNASQMGKTAIEWYTPKNQKSSDTCMMYLHGGAYIAGSLKTHRAMLMHWAKIV